MKIKPASGEFKLSLGDRGEIIAADYLSEKGYEILEKKARAPFGEIDLIAKKEGVLVFVEVKTRASARRGLPQEAVDERKQKQMTRLAEWFLQKNSLHKSKTRFDVVAILYNGETAPQIQHFQNAFEAAA